MKLADDLDELRLQTQEFLKSELGKYIVTSLEEMRDARMSGAKSVGNPEPMRMLDRAVGVEEALEFIKSPL